MTGVLLTVGAYGVCATLALLAARWVVVRAQNDGNPQPGDRSDGGFLSRSANADKNGDADGSVPEKLLFRGIEWLLCSTGIVLLIPWAVAEGVGDEGTRTAGSWGGVALFALLVGVSVVYCRWSSQKIRGGEDIASNRVGEDG